MEEGGCLATSKRTNTLLALDRRVAIFKR